MLLDHTHAHLQIGSGNRNLCPSPAIWSCTFWARQELFWEGYIVIGKVAVWFLPWVHRPVRLQDVRLRRKCPWEEVIWGTRLTSDRAGQKFP